MPKIEKRFDLTISKKFPDGNLLSATFGTLEEREIRDDLSLQEIEKAKKELFKQVHENTLDDIKLARKTDPLIKSIWKDMVTNIKREDRVAAAERENA
jgi:hypothetical protein